MFVHLEPGQHGIVVEGEAPPGGVLVEEFLEEDGCFVHFTEEPYPEV